MKNGHPAALVVLVDFTAEWNFHFSFFIPSLLGITPEGLNMRNPGVFSGACGAELAGD
jgi:hypothetical protein